MGAVAIKYKWATLLLILLLFSTSVQAQSELVDNGDFETGDYDGWTAVYTGNEMYCYVGWEIEDGFTGCIFPYFDRLAGNYSAVNDFDGSVSQFYMYQDVTIPSGVVANFSFIYRIQYYNDPVFPWILPRTFDVQVRDPDTDALLGTLHSFVTNIPSDCGEVTCSGAGGPVENITKFDTGLVTVGPVDMSAWAGQTVRLYFLENIPEYMTGGAIIVIDNISVMATPCSPHECHDSSASPVRNAYNTQMPTLVWGRISWAQQYQLQVADNDSFIAPVIDAMIAPEELPQFTTEALSSGRYFWRVRVQAANNSWGDWSQLDEFYILEN